MAAAILIRFLPRGSGSVVELGKEDHGHRHHALTLEDNLV
jgi:hypothetical protein